MNLSPVLSYYRDCYKADSADLNLWNLNRLKKEDRLVLEGTDDMGSGFLPRLPIPGEFAEPMLKRVGMYQRERVLLYVSFILAGKLEINGETKPVVSPLLYNEACIEEEDGSSYFVAVQGSVPQINESLTRVLMPESALPEEHGDGHIQTPSLWTQWLKASPVELNSLELLNFPKLVGDAEIKGALKAERPSLLSASMLVFVERSSSSRGVLHEIGEIIGRQNATQPASVSPPLQALFTGSIPPMGRKNVKYDYLPGLLSSAQKKVLSIAVNSSLGCVSGPPGTGKSYTIAAIAAEHMARGESVLIVANNEPALDVIADKLDENFSLGTTAIRAGQKAFLKQLKTYVADLLSGYYVDELAGNPTQVEAELKVINSELSKLEKQFTKFCRRAITRGHRLHRLQDKSSNWLLNFYLSLTKSSIKSLTDHWCALEKINLKLSERELKAGEYLSHSKSHNLKVLLETQRKSLQAFNKAIRSRSSQRQFELFDEIEYSTLLSAFPVWLVSLNTLHRVLPLKAEMFDLVIIDEATQCNISSCLPALYRAKRALIVGDTKQLRHYSFLARAKQTEIQRSHDLAPGSAGVVGYRDNSILDLALDTLNSQDQLALLDEHFRSKPELIHFSNREFYNNQLRVMQHRPCTSSGHLHIHRTCGVRDRSGVNKTEADAVIRFIADQIAQDREAGHHHSIGILSPFRDQAEYLSKQLEMQFSEVDIANHRLRAATPFGFQGEERDIMLISFALDNSSRRASTYLNKDDVFNVAITRARQQQVLFVSFDESDLPEQSLLRRYICSVSEFKAQHLLSHEIDQFQHEVAEQLNKLGIETWCGYEIAGTDLDVLCRKDGRYLAIDLIGYPGPWQDYLELNTYKLLRRAGIDVLPVSYGLWIVDRDKCLSQISAKFSLSQ